MKLTRASTYALAALAYLAGQKKQEQPIASHLVAQAQGIPERFLLKVLKPLVSARVLRSVKGPNGGYRLARPAKEITLCEIIEAVDGPIQGHVAIFEHNGNGQAKLDKQLETICGQSANLIRGYLTTVTLFSLATKNS